jgi:hypothetical protein
MEVHQAHNTFGDLFWPTFYVYLLWWVPYSIWLICHGVNLPEKGYETGYQYFATFGIGKIANYATCGIVSEDSKYGGVLSYLFFHFIGIFLPSICVCYIFFMNYTLNLLFCILCVALSTQRGAKYYNYLMCGAFEKILREAEQSAAAQAGQTQEDEEEIEL